MKEHQQRLDKEFKKLGWKYWSPMVIVARLFEEGGEFARLINHLYGPKPKKATEAKQDLEDEVGDLLFTLICFANSHGMDLDKVISKNIDKVFSRDKDRYKKV